MKRLELVKKEKEALMQGVKWQFTEFLSETGTKIVWKVVLTLDTCL